ncbi:MAG: ABC transporter transmembrane domain-containing protein, partial [Candidatus Hodarchaeota archaeon]
MSFGQPIHKEKITNVNIGFWRWFLGHLFANPIVIVLVILGPGASIFTRALIPVVLGQAIDIAIIDIDDVFSTDQQLQILGEMALLIIMLGVIQFIVSAVTSLTNEWLSWTSRKRIREEFFNSMQNKPLKFHDS